MTRVMLSHLFHGEVPIELRSKALLVDPEGHALQYIRSNIYIYMYIYVYVYIYIFVYIYIYIYIYIANGD